MLITPVRENFGLLKSIQHEESELVEKLEQWTRRRYEELLPVFYQRLANGMIRECAGFSVIVDAVFIEKSLRQEFRNLGSQLDVSFVVFDCLADEKTILKRIRQRHQNGADPSEAGVPQYLSQLQHQEPLSDSELARTIHIDTTQYFDVVGIKEHLESLLAACQSELTKDRQ